MILKGTKSERLRDAKALRETERERERERESERERERERENVRG